MANRKRPVHRAFIEERRDEDTYSETMALPGYTWALATCAESGRYNHCCLDPRTFEEAMRDAVGGLDYHCDAEHVQ